MLTSTPRLHSCDKTDQTQLFFDRSVLALHVVASATLQPVSWLQRLQQIIMSTAAICISSSPPPLFAREPTPVDSSPPARHSSSHNDNIYATSPKRFKTSNATRDSFAGGFSSARSLLAVKLGAENIPVKVGARDRFKSPSSSPPRRRSPPFAMPGQKRQLVHVESPHFQQPTTANGSGDKGNRHQTEPQGTLELPTIEKAVPRRLDWTPVKEDGDMRGDSDGMQSLPKGMREALMNDFGFKAPKAARPENPPATSGILKRKRIEVVEGVTTNKPVTKASVPKKKPATVKKAKAPAKKVKTITDRVTALHNEKGKNESPIAEFLVATQARGADQDQDAQQGVDIQVATRKPRAVNRKAALKKSKLLSPASANKALEQQVVTFGSASQLIRDEPQPEMELSSDPVSSPLRTQPISIESTTPKTGTSRFVRTKNLWGAGDRDENNALLYVDTVDLIDTPAPGAALTGTDVLLNPGGSVHPDVTAQNVVLHHKLVRTSATPSRSLHAGLIADVDDFSSPFVTNAARAVPITTTGEQHRRLYHTSAPASAQKTDDRQGHEESGADAASGANAQSPPPIAKPTPNYAGMHDDELKKAVKAYGYKAIRSRQKMIELLTKCWDEKEARRLAKLQQPDATQTVAMKHSDVLSNVHDLSNRPVPKVKKTRKKAVAAKEDDDTPKEPKKRKRATPKKAEVGEAVEKVKKPRGRKPKLPPISEEKVVDIDNVNEETKKSPTKKRAPKAAAKSPRKKQLPTPPATIEPNDPVPVTKSTSPKTKKITATKHAPRPATDPELHGQIQAAVLVQSEKAAQDHDWDHVRNPTWHEKMLLYDPIILEDLTRWLNTEGLALIHEDREITALEVRGWCESRGICCLWKGGWRGNKGGGG